MPAEVRIEAIRLHWLFPDPGYDLCAHAAVEVWIGEERFLDHDDPELAVSAGALHLLRTLTRDHTAESPVAEHLVPCCGHFMVVDPDTGLVENLGCSSGLDFWVRHRGDRVALVRPDGAEREVSAAAWAGAVAAFADQVDAFYRDNPPRVPGDEHDAAWFGAMRAEWSRLRALV